jgi:hypothetical protein
VEACSVIRLRLRPEFEAEFLARHDNPCAEVEEGLCQSYLVQTGERSYVLIGEWLSANAMRTAEPVLLQSLDQIRHMFEDLGGGQGHAEPMWGRVVASHRFPRAVGDYWSG